MLRFCVSLLLWLLLLSTLSLCSLPPTNACPLRYPHPCAWRPAQGILHHPLSLEKQTWNSRIQAHWYKNLNCPHNVTRVVSLGLALRSFPRREPRGFLLGRISHTLALYFHPPSRHPRNYPRSPSCVNRSVEEKSSQDFRYINFNIWYSFRNNSSNSASDILAIIYLMKYI